ncbi:polygalacturonase [Selaginella moellendorffii]|uniref:polygalacturonase n=1 Tax=Selaginella moellendorffii TaxID=88036 RepID=UPI000D1C887A|nr:polygalacturonase [Selaginella moellendorffii]|eukprot:XP_024529135.1 polygalacturonase [Selaginella moellendorffii]
MWEFLLTIFVIFPSLDSARTNMISSGEPNVFNVRQFNARGDGIQNDTQAFLDAWNAACLVEDSVFLIPQSFTFLIWPASFKGPCKSNMTMQALWVFGSTGLNMSGIRIQNSQQMNVAFVSCHDVIVAKIRIENPQNSPNTDGIHIESSTNVTVEHAAIGTGDDCVSIGSGSSNVVIRDCECGPGHGISIGSLGKGESAAYVSSVLVHRVQITGTMNGLRIKTWQGGRGSASNIRFENVSMSGVANPIIIDQNYCDALRPCSPQGSAVQVKSVEYLHIRGTSATAIATSFDCSASLPCLDLLLHDINLTQSSGAQASASCSNAFGVSSGSVVPASCLA